MTISHLPFPSPKFPDPISLLVDFWWKTRIHRTPFVRLPPNSGCWKCSSKILICLGPIKVILFEKDGSFMYCARRSRPRGYPINCYVRKSQVKITTRFEKGVEVTFWFLLPFLRQFWTWESQHSNVREKRNKTVGAEKRFLARGFVMKMDYRDGCLTGWFPSLSNRINHPVPEHKAKTTTEKGSCHLLFFDDIIGRTGTFWRQKNLQIFREDLSAFGLLFPTLSKIRIRRIFMMLRKVWLLHLMSTISHN